MPISSGEACAWSTGMHAGAENAGSRRVEKAQQSAPMSGIALGGAVPEREDGREIDSALWFHGEERERSEACVLEVCDGDGEEGPFEEIRCEQSNGDLWWRNPSGRTALAPICANDAGRCS